MTQVLAGRSKPKTALHKTGRKYVFSTSCAAPGDKGNGDGREGSLAPVDHEGVEESEGAQGAEDQEEPEDDQEPIDDDEEEAQGQRVFRNPGQPTQAMIDEHRITHMPYRPWCEHCVRGKAKRKQSLKIKGEYTECAHT